MADVTARMLALLSTLQSGRAFSAAELTRTLGTSPRTLRRDVERLRGYGYPVQTRPGPGGYYRLAAGRTMPPLLLDDDEAVATAIALATLATVGESTEGGIDAAATRAYGKLDQFLPARLRPQLAAIRASLETSRQPAPSLRARQIALVAGAIDHREILTFGYTDARGEGSERRVEPYRQVHHLLRWYLLAFDLAREDWRVFRLDRMVEVRNTGRRFQVRELPAESALDYLRHGFSTGREQVTVVVDAPVDDLADAFKYQEAEIRSVSARQTRLTIALDSWQWLVLNLAFLGVDFRIEAGAHARDSCRAFGERLIAATSEAATG